MQNKLYKKDIKNGELYVCICIYKYDKLTIFLFVSVTVMVKLLTFWVFMK